MLNMVEGKTEPGLVIPLTPKQTEAVVKAIRSKRATFLDLKEFQKSTKGLPQSTPLAEVLAYLKKPKPPKA
jgi:hypothetical protein